MTIDKDSNYKYTFKKLKSGETSVCCEGKIGCIIPRSFLRDGETDTMEAAKRIFLKN